MTFASGAAAFGSILLISGVFSMFGKGGGALFTPVLLLLGMTVGPAVSTSLFLNLVTAAVATVVFWRYGLVDFKFSAWFLPGTIVGSVAGSLLSSRAPQNLILGVFAVFLYAAGVLMFLSPKESGEQITRPVNGRVLAVVTVFSFGVGLLSSLIGVGGGLMIFPFLLLYMRYGARKAAGANAFIVMVSSFVGSASHFALGSVDPRFITVMAVACVGGSAIGSRVTVKASPAFIKVGFAVLLWFFAGQITLKLLGIV